MSDLKLLLFVLISVAGLSYCAWKTLADWRNGLWRAVVWGVAACIGALTFLLFVLSSVFIRLY